MDPAQEYPSRADSVTTLRQMHKSTLWRLSTLLCTTVVFCILSQNFLSQKAPSERLDMPLPLNGGLDKTDFPDFGYFSADPYTTVSKEIARALGNGTAGLRSVSAQPDRAASPTNSSQETISEISVFDRVLFERFPTYLWGI